ncbi:hypothetical protein M885DRAFT_453014 [Pelagophyceae sp. CCMP2097]|nr:hypothetical protein M885DRAFT_453014 [Pelagophyceae sp. CCMP2097]
MVDEPVGEAAGVSVRRPGGAVDRRNAASLTPLHVAAQQCCDEAVSLLLSSGAVAGAPARTGHTPLHACCAARAPPPCVRGPVRPAQKGANACPAGARA